MIQKTAGSLLVGLLVLAGAVGCKKDEAVQPFGAGATGGAIGEPTTAVAFDAGATPTQAQDADAGAADPDLAVLTVIAVDIDTKLAAMCEIPQSRVFFKFDSTKLVPEAKERLQEIATCATTGPAKGKELLIVGRADPVGSDAYNKQLGVSRAETVAKYLQEQGVKQARTETESKGEPEAAVPPSQWPLERRVTIRLKE